MTSSQPVMQSSTASAAAQSSAALSSNLSELDNLLQELTSTQFAVEVDRRSTGFYIFNTSVTAIENGDVHVYFAPEELRSIVMSLSVCLSVYPLT